jgi:hypothetical protein
MPFKHDYAISTDAAFAPADEAILLLQGHDSAVKDRAMPSVGSA